MSKKRELSKITELIIHCAATPNGAGFTAKDIDHWHAQRGFSRAAMFISAAAPLQCIGYHYVIDCAGRFSVGRLPDETGAHALHHNTQSLGVCLMGTDQFTGAQWLVLKQLVQALTAQLPGLAVIGHREINAHKTCPGFDVKAWLAGASQPLAGHVYVTEPD